MPGVDRATLQEVFTKALAPDPDDRFASCAEFSEALANAIVPELPLVAAASGPGPDDLEAVEPFVPEAAPSIDDVSITAADTDLSGPAPDFDALDRAVPVLEPEPAVASWNHGAAAPIASGPRFGGIALILAAIVGAVFGFAAGYMARPRALQTEPPQTMASAPGTEADVASPKAAEVVPPKAPEAPNTPAPDVPKASRVSKAPQTGQVLVRSNPSGATVSVNGVERGVTPLALRDLAFGTHTITLARRGYAPQTSKVALTSARPSRSVDVRLAAVAQPASPKPTAKPPVGTGVLIVESRPVGAAITVNGKPSGNTPRTIPDLAPGEYRIVLSMPGYLNFATNVRVVAGERVRAAASLTAQEKE